MHISPSRQNSETLYMSPRPAMTMSSQSTSAATSTANSVLLDEGRTALEPNPDIFTTKSATLLRFRTPSPLSDYEGVLLSSPAQSSVHSPTPMPMPTSAFQSSPVPLEDSVQLTEPSQPPSQSQSPSPPPMSFTSHPIPRTSTIYQPMIQPSRWMDFFSSHGPGSDTVGTPEHTVLPSVASPPPVCPSISSVSSSPCIAPVPMPTLSPEPGPERKGTVEALTVAAALASGQMKAEPAPDPAPEPVLSASRGAPRVSLPPLPINYHSRDMSRPEYPLRRENTIISTLLPPRAYTEAEARAHGDSHGSGSAGGAVTPVSIESSSLLPFISIPRAKEAESNSKEGSARAKKYLEWLERDGSMTSSGIVAPAPASTSESTPRVAHFSSGFESESESILGSEEKEIFRARRAELLRGRYGGSPGSPYGGWGRAPRESTYRYSRPLYDYRDPSSFITTPSLPSNPMHSPPSSPSSPPAMCFFPGNPAPTCFPPPPAPMPMPMPMLGPSQNPYPGYSMHAPSILPRTQLPPVSIQPPPLGLRDNPSPHLVHGQDVKLEPLYWPPPRPQPIQAPDFSSQGTMWGTPWIPPPTTNPCFVPPVVEPQSMPDRWGSRSLDWGPREIPAPRYINDPNANGNGTWTMSPHRPFIPPAMPATPGDRPCDFGLGLGGNQSSNARAQPVMFPPVHDFIPAERKHERFWFEDGSVEFEVKGKAYKVHEHFFDQHASSFFFRAPEPGRPNVIRLSDIEPHEFDLLLSLFYPKSLLQHDAQTLQEWSSILRVAHLYSLDKIRPLAISHIEPLASAAEKIELGQKYGVSEWLVPAYMELALRMEGLSVEEGNKVGVEGAMMIADMKGIVADGVRKFVDRAA